MIFYINLAIYDSRASHCGGSTFLKNVYINLRWAWRKTKTHFCV